MSRVGKDPVILPSAVQVEIGKDTVKITGPKGSLEQQRVKGIEITESDGKLVFARKSDEPKERSSHGLMRALVQNMVTGVNEGFSKQLQINGVGFRVSLAGNQLKLNLGFSHDVNYTLPEGVTAQVEQNNITLTGIDKQKVGQVAAEIRAMKKPEPYKGKGIMYAGERILRKSGKSGKET